MENILMKILRRLNHPFLSWGIMPFSMILFGTIIGMKQNMFHIFSFILLYLFLLITSFLERALIKKISIGLDSPFFFKKIFWISFSTIFILFLISVNWLSVGMLVLYLLFIFTAYYPKLKMEQTIYYTVLHLFFKVIIMNIMAYYVQTRFLDPQLLLYISPLVFLFLPLVLYRQKSLFYEENSRYQYFLNLYFFQIMISSYIFGITLVFTFFNLLAVQLLYQVIFIIPLLFVLSLLALKTFRSKMKMDNYINILLFITILLYALFLKIPI